MAAKKYLKLWHNMSHETRKLTDDEFGKLIRALIAYDIGGELPEQDFDGALGAYFAVYQSAIDRDHERTEEISRTRQDSVNARWHKEQANSAAAADGDDELLKFAWENIDMTTTTENDLKTYRDSLGDEVVQHAIEQTAHNGSRKFSYVRSILDRYTAKGITSMDAVRDDERAHAATHGSAKPADKFNYQQHTYTEADFGSEFYYDPAKDYGNK